MRFLFLLIIFLGLKTEGCKNANHVSMSCNEQNAKTATDIILEKKGQMVRDMVVKIQEDSIYFVIEYLPIDTMKLGGGGMFKVLKSNCRIVEQKFYQ